MAVLDLLDPAIQTNCKCFPGRLDGRIKCGRDNEPG
jgi:hypothetical protein